MHRSTEAVLTRVMIQALILSDFVIRPALGISCTYTNELGSCFLANVAIFTDFDAKKFTFPSAKTIVLYAPTIIRTGQELLNHLPNDVETLYIYDGSVPELVIKNTPTEINVYRSLVRDVIINGTNSYSLKELAITYNQLRSVPQNINKLTNLQMLYLHDNEIVTVNMDQFVNLIHLELLALQRNKITRIETSVSLGLPNLVTVDLQTNYIENLSIKLWNMNNLKTIHLNNNKLRKIDNFWGHFPNLTKTYFAQNQWSCAWLEQTLPLDVNSEKFKVYGGETCPEKDIRGLCCYDSVEDVKNSLDKSIIAQYEQIAAKLDRTNEQLKIIKARVNENRALIGDVLRKNSREVDNIQTAMDRNVKLIKEEVVTVESTCSTKVSENRADTHKLEEKIGQMKIDVNRNVLKIEEKIKLTESAARMQVESEFREVSVKINESWALLEDDRKKFEIIDEEQKQLEEIIVSLQSDMERSVQTTMDKINTLESSAKKQKIEHAQLEEKVGGLKSDFVEKLSSTNIKMKDELQWVKEKLNENRALIDDVVDDLYLEELEKQEL